MSKHLVRDLENLQRQILAMAGVVEDVIYKSILAFQERDKNLAQEVIATDSRIDEYDNRVIEECLKILALHQPVAKDLRRIATVMMITTDLERIGDLAVDIAGRAIVLAAPPLLTMPANLPRMTDLTTTMVRQSMDAFVNLDSKLARRVIRLDDEVDRYHAEIIDDLRVLMHAKPEFIDPACPCFRSSGILNG